MNDFDILDVVKGCDYTFEIPVGTLADGETISSVTLNVGVDSQSTPVTTKNATVTGGVAKFVFSNTDTGSMDTTVPNYYFSVKRTTNQRITMLVTVAKFVVSDPV